MLKDKNGPGEMKFILIFLSGTYSMYDLFQDDFHKLFTYYMDPILI